MTNAVDDFKKYIKTLKGDSDNKDITQAIERLTDKDKANQLGKLTKKERQFIFQLIVANALFFKNSERINKLIEQYMLLSKSEGGTALELITSLYKVDVTNQTNMQLGLGQPKKMF